MNWLYAFLLTGLIELPLVACCANRGMRRRAATDSIAANLVTHPIAWYLVRSLEAPWLAIEIGVATTELLIYRTITRLSWSRAATASLLANGITAALSFVV
jgi:hypothetical protein